MRIAHVIASLNPRMGGLPKTARELAAAQADQGHEVALCSEDGPEFRERLTEVFGERPGADVVEILELPRGVVNRAAGRETARRLAAWNPRILHVHGLWEPVLFHAQRWAARRGVPVVLLPQSMLHPWQSSRRRVAKFGVRTLVGYERLWRRAACVQVLSEAEADHWKPVGARRVEVIPNGIFPGEDAGDSGRTVAGLPPPPFLLSLARLHPQKAPEVLLEAFARIAEAFPMHRLVFAGAEYGSGPHLRARARKLGLEERVVFSGLLEGADRWAALHRCDLFALPSRAEGFSLALLEAALAGTACVISPECNFDRLVEAGGAVRIPVDAAQWAEAIRGLLSRPDARGRMGGKARELVRSEYTWSGVADRLLSLYGELIG